MNARDRLGWVLFLGFVELAQAQERCPDARFDEVVPPLQALTIERIEGEALATASAFPGRVGHAGNVCLVLYREPSRSQVASSVTKPDGAFRLEDVGVGEYILVARPLHSGIAPIRVPLHIVTGAGVGTAAQRGLFVRFTVEGSGPAVVGIIRDLQLRQQLRERVKVDQEIRMEMIRQGSANVSPELQKRMDAIDAETDAFLREIVRVHGWPDKDLAGLDGSGAASTMLMHVSAATEKQALPLIEAGVKRGTVQAQTYAMLFDHLRVSEGKPQRYGTVAKPFTATSEVQFLPIEDEANVDARRAEMGLPSLAEYREVLRKLYFPESPQSPGGSDSEPRGD